jgi:DNA repair exonuclease SbcCD ATPase subunit
MKIEKIKIQNFYSFKDVVLNVSDYSGLTLIKGANKDTGGSNGSGKSALVEAIYFALTGKTIRKSTEDSLVNNQAKKKCMVEIHLTHKNEYVVITRHKKPTKLEFLVGSEDRTREGVIATQQAIEEYFNINPKVLLASMFFGQSNDISFLDCSSDDKRTIIRNFLNLDDIFSLRDNIRGHKSTFYQTMKERDAVVEENQKTIKKLDAKVDEIEEAKKEYSSYDEYDLSLTLDDILEGERKERDLNFTIAAHRKEADALEDQMHELQEHINNPSTVDVCEKCGSETRITMDPILLQNRLGGFESSLLDQQRTMKKLEDSRWTPPVSSKEFSKLQAYRDLCRDETNYTEMKVDLYSAIDEALAIKDENKTWYEVMRFWEKAFSEQGVIKHIVNNVLSYFNSRCNFYLSYLTNSKYFVEFDQELNEKIETEGHLVQYISLSGGEKRKINLAVTLGLKDLLLLTDKSHLDLLFFDEVAENIDEEGITGLYQLLQEIKEDKSIFIITHNKYLKTLLDSSPRLAIIKHKGISTIKE